MQTSAVIEILQNLLNEDDLDGFFSAYEHYALTEVFEPSCLAITQVAFPSALRRSFEAKTITARTIVTVWRLTASGQLLLVENDLRVLINLHIDEAMKTLQISTDHPAQPLSIYSEARSMGGNSNRRQAVSATPHETMQMKRISIVSTFAIRTWSATSAFDLRRNLCESGQEREFLRALRQYFPTMLSYPNVTLQNFIDLGELETAIPSYLRDFLWRSRVDVLLCTNDEDPVAGFELDSPWHDTEGAADRDEKKNTLFQLAGIPLVQSVQRISTIF
jgi:hypothetical protein